MTSKVLQGDCLELMKDIPDKSIDMILCDLPYGTTRNNWDSIISLELLWEQYNRIIKDNGAIVLTAQTPFDKVLGVSNLNLLKYEWIWEKSRPSGHLNAKKMPLKNHENVLVFYKKLPVYNPQFTIGSPNHIKEGHIRKSNATNNNYGYFKNTVQISTEQKYPKSIQCFKQQDPNKILHPTQKPVALFEYLIKTYTNEGDLVLDNCAGSGTTAIACLNTNRNYILMEKEQKYFDIINERVEKWLVK